MPYPAWEASPAWATEGQTPTDPPMRESRAGAGKGARCYCGSRVRRAAFRGAVSRRRAVTRFLLVVGAARYITAVGGDGSYFTPTRLALIPKRS